MSLCHNNHTPLGSLGQQSSHVRLSARMKVDFGFLQVDQAALVCSQQRDEHRQSLRNAESNIVYVHDIMDVSPIAIWKTSNPDLQLPGDLDRLDLAG